MGKITYEKCTSATVQRSMLTQVACRWAGAAVRIAMSVTDRFFLPHNAPFWQCRAMKRRSRHRRLRSPMLMNSDSSLHNHELMIPGLFNNLFMTRRGGGVISQTASQHAYFSAKFCKFPFKISDILQKTKNFDNHLRFAAIPAKFCENRGEK